MQRFQQLLCPTVCLVLLASLGYTGHAKALEIESGKKAKVKGSIVSRTGDLVNVREKKDEALVTVALTDGTQIERVHDVPFLHKGMDIASLVPGLNIEAEGVGNAKGQLEAKKIKFDPNEFGIEVAEEQQILANQSAAKKAQLTANSGVSKANAAQSSANQAQASSDVAQASADVAQISANQAQSSANAAGELGVMDADAIAKVNHRVSDLDDYSKVAEAGIYFPADGATLDDAAKADLSQLAAAALPLDGYMIEIAGYASSTGAKQWDQKLAGERASAVAQYLREQKNIPLRRMLTPASYGSTHPDATNSDPQGRALNRRVDVSVLVNKGLQQ